MSEREQEKEKFWEDQKKKEKKEVVGEIIRKEFRSKDKSKREEDNYRITVREYKTEEEFNLIVYKDSPNDFFQILSENKYLGKYYQFIYSWYFHNKYLLRYKDIPK